ncbi:Phosphatidylserine synthase 2 [Astathelohania contejeani]|uniref:Phosphatidylserine synthase 2 n=1 Tax=Astathelohania contejeani TaxID=164912 RepID=A0ABQ7HY78_9MICR|nr:Phosphatidylserine synthase 2 [Thelohania contejeani]
MTFIFNSFLSDLYSFFKINTDLKLIWIFIALFITISLFIIKSSLAIKNLNQLLFKTTKIFGLFYLFTLLFFLLQEKDYTRIWLKNIDSKLGEPLLEKDYAMDCKVNYRNLYNQMDYYILAHLFGFFAKALIFRDYFFCWLISILFEIMEYTLVHHHPNFSECWWDHWVLDVLICNSVGIWMGISVCKYFNMKLFNWRRNIRLVGYQGNDMYQRAIDRYKICVHRRVSLINNHKGSNVKDFIRKNFLWNYITITLLSSVTMIAELNIFYLKAELWVPPDHPLIIARLLLYGFMGFFSVKEIFLNIYENHMVSMNQMGFICASIIFFEVMLSIKYNDGQYTFIFPMHIKIFWFYLIVAIIIGAICSYYRKDETRKCIIKLKHK